MKRAPWLALALVCACGAPDGDLADDEIDGQPQALDGVPVVISEFRPGSSGWIELYNSGKVAMDLSGWSIDDEYGGGTAPKVLAGGTSIAPNGFLTVSYAGFNARLRDFVRLTDARGTQIDNHGNVCAGSDIDGLCCGRTTDENAWAPGRMPCTPGAPNSGGTSALPPVRVNEFKPGSSGWVEVFNASTNVTVDLKGWTIDDVSGGGAAPKLIGTSTPVGPRGRVVLAFGGINTSSTDLVRLVDPSGSEVDRHDNFYAGASNSGKCFGRLPDGLAWSAGAVVCTMGQPNGPAPGGGSGDCTATGGTYKTVAFTAAEECKALDYMNHARYSQLPLAPVGSAVYDCDATSHVCGYRTAGWTSLAQFADFRSGLAGPVVMQELKTKSAAWTSDGRSFDTVADAWRDLRVDQRETPLTLDKVWVEKLTATPRCAVLRDAPDSPNYITACVPQCYLDTCSFQQWQVGQYQWVRGNFDYGRPWFELGQIGWNVKSATMRAANPARP